MTDPTKIPRLLFVLALMALMAAPLSAEDESLPDLPMVHEEDFESGADGWAPTDPTAWTVAELDGGGHAYELTKKQSAYEPPHRSPYNISLLEEHPVTDFVLTTKLQTTHESYGHRSLCLFFGYQDPAHFYYVHFGQEADDHANQIFIVDGAARTKISTKTTEGTPWKDAPHWHGAKIVRDTKSGSIEVYFDDMETPVMTANDKTFTSGTVGVGSFDDTGMFDDIVLRGEKAE
ncbi:hypothetical protein BH23VER1_BH23VER1_01430 [soil metagenome]